MHEPNLYKALQESLVEVLEKMFFIRALEAPPEQVRSSCPGMAVRLAFEGEPPGSLTLCTTRAVGRSIAADFLGEDESELSERQVEEVVCELANMICGSVLSRVESRALFRLGSPLLLPPEEDFANSLDAPDGGPDAPTDDGATVRVAEVGGGALTVQVHTEGRACRVVEKYAF